MSAKARDLRISRQSLTAEERIKLIGPYLPPTEAELLAAEQRSGGRSRFGIRKALRSALNLLVYNLIHTVFSIYIRIRQAYHTVAYRVLSILYYHHRTPELIDRDVKGLKKKPRHLSVILKLDDERGGAGLERLVNEAAEIAAWCACAGIPMLSIYEKTGILKGYLPETHRAMSRRLAAYFGRRHVPGLTLQAPHTQAIETSGAPPRLSGGEGDVSVGVRRLSVMLLSYEDGRDSIVDLTKTLADMCQRGKLAPGDISMDLVDAELTENVMGEPDLLVLFGPYVDLAGYPPWQLRLTEIFHVRDNHSVGYQVFLRGLYKFANAEMRLGR